MLTQVGPADERWLAGNITTEWTDKAIAPQVSGRISEAARLCLAGLKLKLAWTYPGLSA
ncbi:MAG: hypothetical protein NXI15_00845 [Gammaproteobacteria bacterium]|jgi:hypothetical protein|nr:hypothetical protein [Gammaproteobacteria bacterium]